MQTYKIMSNLLETCKNKFEESISVQDKNVCLQCWQAIFEEIVSALNGVCSIDEVCDELIKASRNQYVRVIDYYKEQVDLAFRFADIKSIHKEIKILWPYLQSSLRNIEEDIKFNQEGK